MKINVSLLFLLVQLYWSFPLKVLQSLLKLKQVAERKGSFLLSPPKIPRQTLKAWAQTRFFGWDNRKSNNRLIVTWLQHDSCNCPRLSRKDKKGQSYTLGKNPVTQQFVAEPASERQLQTCHGFFQPLDGAVNVFICTGHFWALTTEGSLRTLPPVDWAKGGFKRLKLTQEWSCVSGGGAERGLTAAQIFRNTFAFSGKANRSTGVKVAALCLKPRRKSDASASVQNPHHLSHASPTRKLKLWGHFLKVSD